ncbi:HNH endonuclease [Frankia sp. AgKG'84/4]|uniref:HNH endonuclease n=1 Tax=Frankia sp. AgKG'84/4 TaxID=573490 RepID=UPI00200DD3B4|nr:hypothetical protein [Frankia sp. AgKG'84/4]MCL9795550.1 hypothetical protein [Frankia sp. AgKG'84/4]
MRPVNPGTVVDDYRDLEADIAPFASYLQALYLASLRGSTDAYFCRRVVAAVNEALDDDARIDAEKVLTLCGFDPRTLLTEFTDRLDDVRDIAGQGQEPDLSGRGGAALVDLREKAQICVELWRRLGPRVDPALTAGAKRLTVYRRARRGLIGRLGAFCSYCELPVVTSLATEHVLPKATFPAYGAAWDNFLLACAACNSAKGENPGYDSVDPDAALALATAAARARGTFRSPRDPAYTSFGAEYTHVLQHVVRLGSTVVHRVDIPSARVAEWFTRGAFSRTTSPVGVLVARVAAPNRMGATRVNAAALDTIRTFSGTTAAFAWDQVHPALRAIAPLFLRASGTYRVAARTRLTDYVCAFYLEHLVVVGMNIPGARGRGKVKQCRVTLGTSSRSITVDAIDARLMLLARTFTPAVTRQLGLPDWTAVGAVKVIDTENYEIAFAQRHWVELGELHPGTEAPREATLRAGEFSDMPLELSVRSIAPAPALGQPHPSATTISMVNLNDNRNDGGRAAKGKKENRIFDRRVYRRTLAWTVAVESLRRVLEAQGANLPPAQLQVLIDAIGTTAGATGCATVWTTLIRSLPGATTAQRDLRTALLTALDGQFLGTRLPPPPPPPVIAPPPGI